MPSPRGDRGPASPVLEEGEWTLLLQLYLARRPKPVRTNDSDLVALSRLLSARAPGRDAALQEWRSPDGLRARMSVFRVLDPDIATRDTKRAIRATEVWSRLAYDPPGLAAAADAVRTRYTVEAIEIALQARQQGFVPRPASQGPAQTYGDFGLQREDGPTAVYVMLLLGPAERLLGASLGGRRLLKIGLSNDVVRRERELNDGFPPGCGLAWRHIASVTLGDGATAQSAERRLLDDLQAQKLTIGGEFVLATPEEVVPRLSAFGDTQHARWKEP